MTLKKGYTYLRSTLIYNLAIKLVTSSIVKAPDWFKSKSLKILRKRLGSLRANCMILSFTSLNKCETVCWVMAVFSSSGTYQVDSIIATK